MKVVLVDNNYRLSKEEKQKLISMGFSRKSFCDCTNNWEKKKSFLWCDRSQITRTNPALVEFAQSSKSKHLRVVEIPFDTLADWFIRGSHKCDNYECCGKYDQEEICENYRTWS